VKQETPPLFYMPYRQRPSTGDLTFYVRTSIDPDEVMQAIPRVIAGLDARLPVEDLMTLEQTVSENVMLDRLVSTLSACFAAVATALAAIGLYGVLAYTVALRTREIGLRMALGANSGRVLSMVLWQVGRMTMIGGVLGVAGGVALGRTAKSLLYGYEGTDPLVIGAVAILLSLVAFGAGYIPALRASRVDPMGALRYE